MPGDSPFSDRRAGGRALAQALAAWAGRVDIVLALPRGGVPVGYEVARALGVPLDVIVVRKIGVPGHEELAMGAIAWGGVVVRHESVIRSERIGEEAIAATIAREREELQRRERAYRGTRPMPTLANASVVLVDDGIATGSTMRAAIQALRSAGVAQVIVAVPVAPPSALDEMAALADAVVCPLTPTPFHAVGLWYDDFGQTTDEEVHDLLGFDTHVG